MKRCENCIYKCTLFQMHHSIVESLSCCHDIETSISVTSEQGQRLSVFAASTKNCLPCCEVIGGKTVVCLLVHASLRSAWLTRCTKIHSGHFHNKRTRALFWKDAFCLLTMLKKFAPVGRIRMRPEYSYGILKSDGCLGFQQKCCAFSLPHDVHSAWTLHWNKHLLVCLYTSLWMWVLTYLTSQL